MRIIYIYFNQNIYTNNNDNIGGDKMSFVPVNSSNLKAVQYFPESQTLDIQFHTSGTYRYSNVPEAIHNGLMSAASHGKYFNQNIKEKYPYKKI